VIGYHGKCTIVLYRAADVSGYHGRRRGVVLLHHIAWQMSLDITADVEVSVLLRHIERQMSLDIITDVQCPFYCAT